MTALDRGEHGEVLEVDYEELPPARNGRMPVLRESDATNLAGVDTGRQTLSHTRISVWLACHRRLQLKYLNRLDLIERPRYFTLGSAYQKAIEWQDPEVGVRYLNGWEPCEACRMTGRNDTDVPEELRELLAPPCEKCGGRGYVGEQTIFHSADAERTHLINEAIVKGASTLYLKRWPAAVGEAREVEYRVRLRSPWTGAYSNTYDLLGYADGVIDPLDRMQRMSIPEARAAFGMGPEDGLQEFLNAQNVWLEGGNPAGAPLEIIENKLVGRVEPAKVKALPLDRQLALARYGLWRATGRPVTRVWYRWVKKPAIKQREGRKKDKSDAETLGEYCERIVNDYEERPDFYAYEADPSFITTKDLLRVEADLWEIATDMRSYMHNGSDGRRRAFPRDTSRCSEYGGCEFIPICTGLPDANALYQVRPKRLVGRETAPEAEE